MVDVCFMIAPIVSGFYNTNCRRIINFLIFYARNT